MPATDISEAMNSSRLIALSGRMGAGKSTAADQLIHDFTRQGASCVLIQFSDVLRRRAQSILDETAAALWGGSDTDTLAEVLSGRQGPFKDQSSALDAALLSTQIVRNATGRPDAGRRTPRMRVLLQRLGAEWYVDGHWTDAVIADCVVAGDNHQVVLTTVRFPDEAQNVLDHGGVVVRLDVSPTEQAKRLPRRDGFIGSNAVLNHPGESALDTWPGFMMRIDTEQHQVEEVSRQIIDAVTLVSA
jgi:hypothetical protein